MDPDNPVVRLCSQGAQAEFQGRQSDARALYEQAWQAAGDDFEKCIAAHYVARFQDTPAQTLHWNSTALEHARAANQELVEPFYASLYLNMGSSYEALGDLAEAQRYYALAAGLGAAHRPD